MKALLTIFTGICVGIIFMLLIVTNSRPEYEVNLITQDVVQVKSNLSDKTYYCTPDSITYTIDIDNL